MRTVLIKSRVAFNGWLGFIVLRPTKNFLKCSKKPRLHTRRMSQTNNNIPESVAEIVDQVIDDLALKDRVTLANLEESEIAIIMMTDYIQHKLSKWPFQHDEKDLIEPEVIVKEICTRLRDTHKLRIVK